MQQPVYNDQGAVLIPLLLLLLCTLGLGLGSWSVLRLERQAQNLQLQSLSCVGLQAIHLKDLQNDLESYNRDIRFLRGAIAAAITQPQTLPALRQTLEALVLVQDSLLARHRGRRLSWLHTPPCTGLRILPPYPAWWNPEWRRPTPDALGPQALVRGPEAPTSYSLGLRTGRGKMVRGASATVRYQPETGNWSARWGSRAFDSFFRNSSPFRPIPD